MHSRLSYARRRASGTGSKAEQKIEMMRKRRTEKEANAKKTAAERDATDAVKAGTDLAPNSTDKNVTAQKAAGAFANSATSDIPQLAAATFIQKTLRGKIVCCPAAAVTAARPHTACAHTAQAGTPWHTTRASAASKCQWHG